MELSNLKNCVKCKEPMDKDAKFCPKCGEEQPVVEETPAMEVEVVEENNSEEVNENSSSDTENNTQENKNSVWDGTSSEDGFDNKTE